MQINNSPQNNEQGFNNQQLNNQSQFNNNSIYQTTNPKINQNKTQKPSRFFKKAKETESILYSLPKKKARILIPKIFSLITLSLIFYGGILLNLSLLKMRMSTENEIKVYSLVIISLLVALGIILNFSKAKTPITFLQTKLKISRHKKIFYNQITSVEKQQNFSDKIFKTYSLKINKKYSIEAIPIETDLQSYLMKLINYSKQTQAPSFQTNQYQNQRL